MLVSVIYTVLACITYYYYSSLGSVCEDQAAVIGTDSSTTEISEPVTDNLGMIIGLIVSGVILSCCCCLFWLICVCCVCRKRKASQDSQGDYNYWHVFVTIITGMYL